VGAILFSLRGVRLRDTFSGNNWYETRLTLADAPPLDAGSLMGVTLGVTRSSSMVVKVLKVSTACPRE